MKKWEKPEVLQLGLDATELLSDYTTICNWNGIIEIGNGNEDYTDPNNKPSQHPNWVWCNVHKRWHPKDHSGESNDNSGIIS